MKILLFIPIKGAILKIEEQKFLPDGIEVELSEGEYQDFLHFGIVIIEEKVENE